METARAAGVEPEFVSWPEFRRITGLTDDDKHQGVCVFTAGRRIYGEGDLDRLADGKLVVALDQISDPQNLGAVLRACAFFGADAVCCSRTAPLISPPRWPESPSGGRSSSRSIG